MAELSKKLQAQACLDAVMVLYDLEARHATPTPVERQKVAAFPGFGCVALDLFPHAVHGTYKDKAWAILGTALKDFLTPEDYASALRSTYSAFYTPRLIMRGLFLGLKHCGVPDDATVLEPGCGIGRFFALAPPTMRFVGIEQETLSARIARLLSPQHEVRCEPIQRTRLDPESVDAVIGNVPFSQEKTTYWGRKLSLHELCLAKSLDALRPGGILALVVTHYLLDRQQTHFRALLATHATLLGAIRLPGDAFLQEGTEVVADLLFLQKRPTPLDHAPTEAWLETVEIGVLDDPDGPPATISRYFVDHPTRVLGTVSRQKRLYAGARGYTVQRTGVLAEQLARALSRLPAQRYAARPATRAQRPARLLPPPVQLAEGSLYVEGDRLYQIRGAQGVPLRHGEREITTTGTLGKRVAHLIQLRDATGAVLHAQQHGATTAAREQARQGLRDIYGAFVRTYGPINKVSLSTREDGTLVRRLPNLMTFRDDPEALLVMALEDYNETTDSATPAAIQTQDVVVAPEPITHVGSAAEGLLVVLSTTGQVDVTAIADLYGQPEDVVLAELGDLLYHDPEARRWETADLYLSGNVKHKLAAAEAALAREPAYQRNVDALQAVQPPDVLPGEIDAHLGAPWIPVAVLQAFAAETFGAQEWQITVAHNRQEALWSVTATATVVQGEAARVTYGTARIDGVTLLQQACNLQCPTIYDTSWVDGTERRVLHQGETLMAREKQRALKAQFQTWAFAEPARSERLVQLYNDMNNTMRQREVSGAHLEFPGMTPLITLTPAQKDAVWQIVTTGNTLLAHDVGGGKTYICLAAGMKMKQAGLIRKPLFLVPNHMLEQFGRMALHLYPGARYLLAGSEDVGKERRKLFAARCLSGTWDGIIMTHSAFERLGMSPAFQEQVFRDLIVQYEALLVQHEREYRHGQHNIRKALEKQKSTYEAKLHDLLKTEKKDDGLLFDELGIDYIFLDESQFFKNMHISTKMQRVAGIQTEGSQRTFDLFLKTRYLHQQRPGRCLTFATATPVDNSMAELYTLQNLLTPEALAARGLTHFDAWAATFGEVVEVMEIAPDGKNLRARNRFAKFVNLPELQQMLRQFANVRTAEQLELPRPELAGGEAQVIACPLSAQQRVLQERLVRRYEAVRSGQAGRRSGEALKITTDGRKLALDARLLERLAQDWAQSKLHALVERVMHHYREGQTHRTTQLIFCELGVHPTEWGFSMHAAVLDALVAAGIPRQELARADEANTDMKKHQLFEQVRQGQVRVLVGSIARMGVGTNVQTRLLALHHLDAPWTPSKIQQAQGRILRQGNLHQAWGTPVYIYRYVTEGSFDAFIWQALQSKAHFIHQLLNGALGARQAADVGLQELSFAQVKAIASGNPALMTLAETEAELRRLTLLEKQHRDSVFVAKRQQAAFPGELARQERFRDQLQADADTLEAWQGDKEVVLDGHLCTTDEARELLTPRVTPWLERKGLSQSTPLGSYRGLAFGLTVSTWGRPEVYLQGQSVRRTDLTRRANQGTAVLYALRELRQDLPARIAQAEHNLARLHQQHRAALAQLATPFVLAAYRQELTTLCHQLQAALEPGGDVGQQGALCAQVESLRQTQERSQPVTSTRQSAPAAELTPAVTTRILAQLAQADGAAPQLPGE